MEKSFLGTLAVWRHPAAGGRAQARVLLVHGLSEHSARHCNTYEWLNAHGFEVVRFDLRGAGESGGRKMYIEAFHDYIEDTAAVFNWICRSLTPLPVFVHGHSLGGAIAAYFTAHYGPHLAGLSLSAPAYLVGSSISPVKIAMGRLLARAMPTLRLPNGDDFGNISRDPAVCKAYAEDPLAYHFNTLQQGNEILKALARMPEQMKCIRVPLLIAHGTADRIIRPNGSFELLRNAASADKQLHYLPSVVHEPHNDLEKEKYLGLLTHWLQQRVRSGAALGRDAAGVQPVAEA